MQATVLAGERSFDRREIAEPEPLAREVIVRIDAVAICGSDLLAYLGRHRRFRAPTILGHELAGTVETVGDQVTEFIAGDRVFVDSTFGCSECPWCERGRKNLCPSYRVLGQDLELPGGLAGKVAVPAENLHTLQPGTSFSEAALVQPMSVAYHAAIDQGQVGPADTVLIVGAGAIGDGILMTAKSVGARVMVADTLAYRLEVARQLGADVVIDASTTDVAAVVHDATSGVGVDVAFEAVGGRTDEVFRLAVAATTRGGRTVVVGLKLEEAVLAANELKSQEKTIVGSQAYPAATPSLVLGKVGDGSIPAGRLVTHELRLDQAEQAFAILASRAEDVLKVVLTRQR
jgi:L-gulonate 5-dehydrogenase